ncbi:MAG: NRAMP family divalent metal transporter [Bacteroidia bacterium]
MLTKLKSLGPGLLYAGAAIGVSHLVQSTKAGATYGYILIIAIVLAHVFKYPFFALGPRYANKTGESLVAGYTKMGRWAVVLLLVLTLSTMFTVQAAVTIVTAGLLQHMGVSLSAVVLSLLLLVICLLILRIGNYSILDNLMKVIMIILSVSTLAAFALSFSVERGVIPSAQTIFTLTKEEDLGFLLAFVGWMPAPLDIAIWHSIWTLAKGKSADNGEFDFRVGFYGTAILGIFFLVLGANTMYGSGEALESSAGGFAAQLITSFTSCLGTWSYWFITIAAFTTMFSTTLTCFDAMPRVMNKISEELKLPKAISSVLIWQILLFLGALSILFFLVSSMRQMVTFATIVSFLTAPILAWLSYRLVLSQPKLQLWTRTEMLLAKAGIMALMTLSILYISSLL